MKHILIFLFVILSVILIIHFCLDSLQSPAVLVAQVINDAPQVRHCVLQFSQLLCSAIIARIFDVAVQEVKIPHSPRFA